MYTAARSLEEWVYRGITQCKKAFERENEGALFEAIRVCLAERCCHGDQEFLDGDTVSLPRWVVEAAAERVAIYMFKYASTGTGRNAKWASRYKQDRIDCDRYECVLEGREHSVKWSEIYLRASEILKETVSEGSPETIRKSYLRVRRRQKANPYRYMPFRYIKVRGMV